MNQGHYPSNSPHPAIAIRSGTSYVRRSDTRRRSAMRNRFFLSALLPLLLTFLYSLPTTAQTWHWVYGENATMQEGMRGVRHTTLTCANVEEGYIAVGTSYDGSGVGDVYVVRTEYGGGSLWEKTYSVSSTSDDHGESIIEVSDGFIIVGHTTNSSGNTDVLLIAIECDGDEIWTMTYGGSDDEYGYDVVEATTGSGASDLIVAGSVDDGSNEDGYLLRVESNGNYVWDLKYDLGSSSDEHFWSLTEVQPIQSLQTEGDIVAAGYTSTSNGAGYQAFVVRVDGTNGSINTGGGLLQGAGLFGGNADEQFYSVIELENPNEVGSGGQPNVVMAGFTTSYSEETSGDMDIYVVKLYDGAPCSTPVQKVIGNQGTDLDEAARCVREVTFTPDQGADYFQWDLALAGYTDVTANPRDMILLTIDPGTLNPSGVVGAYGHDAGIEDAWSVWPVDETEGTDQGFILCGFTDTEWHTPSPLDPQDLYLVKVDNQGQTDNCLLGYNAIPLDPDPEWDNECVEPGVAFIGGDDDPNPIVTGVNWDDIVCTNEDNDGYSKRIHLSDDLGSFLPTRPNPLNRNQPLVLTLNGFNIDDGLTLSVTNSRGEEIASEYDSFMPSKGEIRLKTDGWPAGLYHITVANGKRMWSAKVIVLD